MKYGYMVYQVKNEEKVFWTAHSLSLKGCVAQGDTLSEAVATLEANEIAWVNEAERCGIPIPTDDIKEVWDECLNNSISFSDSNTCGMTYSAKVSEPSTDNYTVSTNSIMLSSQKYDYAADNDVDVDDDGVTLKLIYRGITATVRYYPENEILSGELENISGDKKYIFFGNDVKEAEENFRKHVDLYYEENF